MDGCYCDTDGESPDIYQDKIVKARKVHRCCECDKDINPGQIYQVVRGLWDGRWSGYKTCMFCATVRERIGAHIHGGLGEVLNCIEYKWLAKDFGKELAGDIWMRVFNRNPGEGDG